MLLRQENIWVVSTISEQPPYLIAQVILVISRVVALSSPKTCWFFFYRCIDTFTDKTNQRLMISMIYIKKTLKNLYVTKAVCVKIYT